MVEKILKVFSHSELEATARVWQALAGNDGIITTSVLADEQKVSRSVYVHTLKMLGIAGVIEAQSLGRSGTHIRVLDGDVLEGVATYGKSR